LNIFADSVYIIHIVIHIMITSNRYIKFIAFAAVLAGFALASLHQHDGTIVPGELVIEVIDVDCTMCDGTVKIQSQFLSVANLGLMPVSVIIDGTVQAAFLPFEKVTKERAPPSRA
jgi:hypothetical protein